MGHIRHIAAGDLTHRINADGSNEMALLAGNVRDMQQALANTVSVVRDGADTIYTGAGEIAAGSNDLVTYRTAGRLSGGDRSQHGTTYRNRETERR